MQGAEPKPVKTTYETRFNYVPSSLFLSEVHQRPFVLPSDTKLFHPGCYFRGSSARSTGQVIRSCKISQKLKLSPNSIIFLNVNNFELTCHKAARARTLRAFSLKKREVLQSAGSKTPRREAQFNATEESGEMEVCLEDVLSFNESAETEEDELKEFQAMRDIVLLLKTEIAEVTRGKSDDEAEDWLCLIKENEELRELCEQLQEAANKCKDGEEDMNQVKEENEKLKLELEQLRAALCQKERLVDEAKSKEEAREKLEEQLWEKARDLEHLREEIERKDSEIRLLKEDCLKEAEQKEKQQEREREREKKLLDGMAQLQSENASLKELGREQEMKLATMKEKIQESATLSEDSLAALEQLQLKHNKEMEELTNLWKEKELTKEKEIETIKGQFDNAFLKLKDLEQVLTSHLKGKLYAKIFLILLLLHFRS